MNDLDLVASLRDEIPFLPPSRTVNDGVMAAIEARPARSSPGSTRDGRAARPGPRRSPGLRLAAAGVVAATACAAGAIGVMLSHGPAQPRIIAWSGNPAAPLHSPALPSVGRARTEAELVDYATRVAAMVPDQTPAPGEWVFVKSESAASTAGGGGFLFGPPNERIIALQWIRADGREYSSGVTVPASLPASHRVTASLRISPGGQPIPCPWKGSSYAYLSSLPTAPAALESVILAANTPTGDPCYSPAPDVAIFTAVTSLLQDEVNGVLIPPKLAATLYHVLQRLPDVHFESETDLAGRTGLGLYMVLEGYYKQEIVIDPASYLYMGEKAVAIKDHESQASDGHRLIKTGQVLGWSALLTLAVVARPGQVP